jgi:hypothetical protein
MKKEKFEETSVTSRNRFLANASGGKGMSEDTTKQANKQISEALTTVSST